MKELFHVHTYRCKHVGDEREIEYAKRAIELGAGRITFTDHAPFPGNPFGHRMKMEELDDYIDTLVSLRDKMSLKLFLNNSTYTTSRMTDYYNGANL